MEVINIKYKNAGSLGKTEKNELVLMDKDKKAYKVDNVVALVWQMCDGTKTIDNIVDAISEKSEMKKPEIKDAVLKIIAQLERFGMLRKV